MFRPQTKAVWIILISLFIFDAVISYWGVMYKGGREADLAIAWLVERFPLLYFLTIPLLMLSMNLLVKGIVYLLPKLIIQLRSLDARLIEKISLQGIAFYWLVGNSSDNFLFLLGFRIQNVWLKTTLIAIPTTIVFLWILINKTLRKAAS